MPSRNFHICVSMCLQSCPGHMMVVVSGSVSTLAPINPTLLPCLIISLILPRLLHHCSAVQLIFMTAMICSYIRRFSFQTGHSFPRKGGVILVLSVNLVSQLKFDISFLSFIRLLRALKFAVLNQ